LLLAINGSFESVYRADRGRANSGFLDEIAAGFSGGCVLIIHIVS
jgi:hypothetical protein